jgi:hypothetical protein
MDHLEEEHVGEDEEDKTLAALVDCGRRAIPLSCFFFCFCSSTKINSKNWMRKMNEWFLVALDACN